MEEELTCTVCKQLYNETTKTPRNLLCGHTFCSECINRLLHFSIFCPECRAPIEASNTENLPTSIQILRILRSTQNKSSNKSTSSIPLITSTKKKVNLRIVELANHVDSNECEFTTLQSRLLHIATILNSNKDQLKRSKSFFDTICSKDKLLHSTSSLIEFAEAANETCVELNTVNKWLEKPMIIKRKISNTQVSNQIIYNVLN